MQKLIGENPQETITNMVWEQWKSEGYTTRPRALTWMDVNNLAGVFLKLCREKQLDYQEFDFSTLIDHTLNYAENKSILFDTIGNPYNIEEKEAVNKLKDYLTEEQLQEYTPQERSLMEEVEQKNHVLEKKVKNLSTNQEKQTLNAEEIKSGLKQVQDTQNLIMAKLEGLPNLEKQIEALKEIQSFKDLGDALSPVIISKMPETTRPLSKQVQAIMKEEKKQRKSTGETLGGLFGFMPGGNNDPLPPQPTKIYDPLICEYCGSKLKPQWTKCVNCGAAIKPHAQFTLPAWIKPHHIHTLDAVAGIFVTIMWLAATGLIIQHFALSFVSVMELAGIWLVWIVVFRLMIGGILD